VPRSESFGPPGVVGASPRSLHTRMLRSDIHCWGQNVHETEHLVSALVTALRHTLQGANYTLAGAEWVQPEWLQQGAVCTVSVEMQLPLVEMRLPRTRTEKLQVENDEEVTLAEVQVNAEG